nr:cytochrome P450 4A11-like [Cavia porcellus]
MWQDTHRPTLDLGYLLLLKDGQTWFYNPQMLTLAFHHHVVKLLMGILADSVGVIQDKWQQLRPEDPPLEISHHVSLLSLDTFVKCACSHQGHIRSNGNNQPYIKAIKDMNDLLYPHMRNVFHHNDIYRLTSEGCWAHCLNCVTQENIGSIFFGPPSFTHLSPDELVGTAQAEPGPEFPCRT